MLTCLYPMLKKISLPAALEFKLLLVYLINKNKVLKLDIFGFNRDYIVDYFCTYPTLKDWFLFILNKQKITS